MFSGLFQRSHRYIFQTSRRRAMRGRNLGSITYANTPISSGLLAYIATQLIVNSTDHRSKTMKTEDILKLCDMWFGLPDDFTFEYEDPRFPMANMQFPFERSLGRDLSRMIALFHILWPKQAKANSISIDKVLMEKTNLDIKGLAVMAFLFSG